MVRAKPFATAFTAVFAALLFATCLGGPAAAQTPAPAAAVHGRAYLFRGLIGLIDWGMDQLADRINREGVAANINSQLIWRTVADQAISDYRRDPKPISVIGHSAGGDVAVEFAETLGAAHVPVALLITYDPNRSAHAIPGNVERYINLYQSSNILGGGDLEPGRGFRGYYASYNLKDRAEIIHVNLDKFDAIQQQLAAKVRFAAAGGGAESVPLRIVYPPSVPIELWDSGVVISAHAGDTLQTIATAYHVPLWALTQINKVSETAALTDGQRIVVPHNLGQKLPGQAPAAAPAAAAAPAPAAAAAPAPAAASAPAAPAGETPAVHQ